MTDLAPTRPRWLTPLGFIAFGFLIAAQVVGFAISPPEVDMGHLQKIMYVHFPIALMAFAAFFMVFVMSIMYLWKRRPEHDLLAASAAETGTVLTGLTLMLGSIWAKPTWGVWWTWDPRLITTAILFIIFAGYLALRSFTEDEDRRARWSAAVGILGFLNVPVVYFSVRIWRTIHQPQSSPETVDSPFVLALRLSFLAVLLVMIWFIATRYHTARLERAADLVREERALEGGVRV